jgi:hypothetical protein
MDAQDANSDPDKGADSETDEIVSEVTSYSCYNTLTQSAQALLTLLTDR